MAMDTIYEKYSFLLIAEKLPTNKNILLSELGYLSKNFEDFLSYQSNVICNKSNVIPKLAELIASFGLVKPFDECEDRDYDSRDFLFEASNAKECFEYLHYLTKHYENIDTAGKRKFLIQALLLCATHSLPYFWSSKETVFLSKEFLEKILICSKHDNLSSLLCDETFHPTLFKAILKRMRPSLMKDTWMNAPSSCFNFYWLLLHIKHPHLIDYFSDVLPPPFMFTNYFAVPQQVLGMKCFDHILDNVPPSLIKSNGVEDAIFDALKKYIYLKDIPVVEALYPCLLKLPMMNLQKVNQLEWLQFDVVLQQLLQNIDIESDPKIRHIFLIQAHLFIKSTPCFKHLKKSLCVLLQNFVSNCFAEEKCRLVSLKIVKELIKSCWPRMENHCYDIMLAILKVIYDIENLSYPSTEALSKEILSLCEECLRLLKLACPKTFRNLVNEYIQDDDSLPGVSLLRSIS